MMLAILDNVFSRIMCTLKTIAMYLFIWLRFDTKYHKRLFNISHSNRALAGVNPNVVQKSLPSNNLPNFVISLGKALTPSSYINSLTQVGCCPSGIPPL